MTGFQCFPIRVQPRLIPLEQRQWWGTPVAQNHLAVQLGQQPINRSNLISFGYALLHGISGISKLHHPTNPSTANFDSSDFQPSQHRRDSYEVLSKSLLHYALADEPPHHVDNEECVWARICAVILDN